MVIGIILAAIAIIFLWHRFRKRKETNIVYSVTPYATYSRDRRRFADESKGKFLYILLLQHGP